MQGERKSNQTDSQWAKAVAEAWKEAMKTNKLFVAAMKESEKCFGEALISMQS